jgi:type I site-specific restriction endonuclease
MGFAVSETFYNCRLLMFNQKSLSERYICTKFIMPALESAGWDRLTQILEEDYIGYFKAS